MAPAVLLLLYLMLHAVGDVDANSPTKCFTGIYTEGSRAFVTCLFNKDIKAAKLNFNVVHYPKSTSGATTSAGDYVLICNWVSDGLACEAETGFTFDREKVSDQLTLVIPSVKRDMEGMYACQMVPYDDVQINTCTLGVEDPTLSDTTGGLDLMAQSRDQHTGVLVWAIVMTLLLFSLLVGVAVLLYKRNMYPDRSKWKPQWLTFPSCCEEGKCRTCLSTQTTSHSGTKDGRPVQCEDTPDGGEDTSVPLIATDVQGPVSATVVRAGNSGTATVQQAAKQADEVDSGNRSSQLNAAAAAASVSRTTDVPNALSKETQVIKLETKDRFTQSVNLGKVAGTQTTKQVVVAEKWRVEDIREWLMEIGQERYQQLLTVGMTGDKLLKLNHISELKKLGIESDDAKWLKEKINKLNFVNNQFADLENNPEHSDKSATQHMDSGSR